MELLLLACVLAASAADPGSTDLNTTSEFSKLKVRTNDSTVYTPAMFYMCLRDDDGGNACLKRCLVEDPESCEIFHHGISCNHILVHMNHIYLGTEDGISRCDPYTRQSCSYIHKTTSTRVDSLTVGGEHLYAGLGSGSVVACNLLQPFSCHTVYTFTNREAWSVQAYRNYIYVGLDNGHLMQCSVSEESASCILSNDMKGVVNGILIDNNIMYTITGNGLMWRCSKDYFYPALSCISRAIDIPQPRAMTWFNGSSYVVKQEQQDGLYICNRSWNPKCRLYAHHKTKYNIAFAYGTHHLQAHYKDEETACLSQPDLQCPNVTYFDMRQRSQFEVHVELGRLYDAAGALVDTRAAGEEQAGPAVFVMAPSGRILLKNYNRQEPVYTSSLLAGSPAAGAGEMVVEQGVIKKITACSPHYLPDLALNQQVVDSLRAQRYTEAIVLEACLDDERPKPTTMSF